MAYRKTSLVLSAMAVLCAAAFAQDKIVLKDVPYVVQQARLD